MTNVTTTWEDGNTTVETFSTESEYYEYQDSIEEDSGIGAENWKSDNWNWTF